MKTATPLLAVIASILAGCQSYQSLPFEPKDLLSEVTTARQKPKHLTQQPLTFADAASQMSAGNPELKELKAEYEKLKAVSDLPTPWSNPELEAGIASGRRMEQTVANKTQPFVSLGFAIPLGPRLSREDNLNKIRTKNAWSQLAAKQRNLYLDLRAAYVNYTISQEALRAREEVINSVGRAREAAGRLSKAGTIGSIELTQMNLEAELENFELVEDQMKLLDTSMTLSDLLGVSSDLMKDVSTGIPDFPDTLPTVTELSNMMLDNNLQLTQIARRFWEDDAVLRLELAKQYPDLKIGGGFEQEVGEKTQIFELSIGLELPLFDLNKQGIAEAVEQRKVTMAAYKTELSRTMTNLEGLNKRYTAQLNQYKQLNTIILPKSEHLMKQAARAVDAGSWNFMRFLDMQRDHRKLIMRKIHLKEAVWATLQAIEEKIGYPLSFFDGEDALIPKLSNQDDTPNEK